MLPEMMEGPLEHRLGWNDAVDLLAEVVARLDEVQDVATLLELATVMEAIAYHTETPERLVDEEASAATPALGLERSMHALSRATLEVHRATSGQKSGLAPSTVLEMAKALQSRLVRFHGEVEAKRHQRAHWLELRAELERIADALVSPALTRMAQRWRKPVAEALLTLDRGGEIEDPDFFSALEPELAELERTAIQVAAAYEVPVLVTDPAALPSQRAAALAAWASSSVADLLKRSPSSLPAPDVASGGERPELAAFVELSLVEARDKTLGVLPALTTLREVLEPLDVKPETGPAEWHRLADVIVAAELDGTLWEAAATLPDIVGAHTVDVLRTVLVRLGTTTPWWSPGPASDPSLFDALARAADSDEVPLPMRIRALCGGGQVSIERLASVISRDDLQDALRSEVGPLASWILDGLGLVGTPADGHPEPGNPDEVPDSAWCWARTGLAWWERATDPQVYANAFVQDTADSGPVATAFELAEQEGDVRRARFILDRVPGGASAAGSPTFTSIRDRWHDAVSSELRAVRKHLEAFDLGQELQEAFDEARDSARQEDYDTAQRQVVELRTASLDHASKVLLEQSTGEELAAMAQRLDGVVNSGNRDRAEILQIRRTLLDIEEQCVSRPPTLEAARTLLDLFLQTGVPIFEGAREPQPPSVSPAVVDPDGPHFGVIKSHLGQRAGFVTPFRRDIVPVDGDVFFHRSAFDAEGSEEADLPRVGSMVRFGNLVQTQGYNQPRATWVEACDEPQRLAALHALTAAFGTLPDGVGVVRRERDGPSVVTLTQGAVPADRSALGFPNGVIVRYRATGGTHHPVTVEGHVGDDGLHPDVRDFFERLGKRKTAKPAESRDSSQVQLDRANLLLIQPGRPDAIPRVREMLQLARVEGDDRLATLIERHGHEPHGKWRRAMLVRCLVITHDPGVLDEFSESVDYLRETNTDADLAWMYTSLSELAKERPDLISLHDLAGFFASVQRKFGTDPHFRIEINLARIYLTLARGGVDSELTSARKAADHVRRATTLNPRLAEASDLASKLEALHPSIVIGETSSGQLRDALPDDPVSAIADLKLFYRGCSEGDLDRARAYYQRTMPHVSGAVKGHLVIEHGHYLLDYERPAEADQLVSAYAQTGDVSDWAVVLDLLELVWTRRRLPGRAIMTNVDQLKQVAPETELYRLDLILTRAFDLQGDYQTSRTHAERSLSFRPTTEARRLLTRAEEMLGQPRLRSKSDDERRQDALHEVELVIASGTDVASTIHDLVVEHVDDREVGPWLLLEVLGQGVLTDEEQRSLVALVATRSEEPTVELLQAGLLVRQEGDDRYRQEGRLQALHSNELRELLAAPSRETLDRLPPSGPWTTYALFSELCRLLPASDLLRWELAKASRDKSVRLASEYVAAALLCIGSAEVPDATYERVATDLLELRLNGLAFALALMDNRHETRDRGVRAIAREACRLDDWEWPSRLQQARQQRFDDAAIDGIDGLVRVLMAHPTHWATCVDFFEVMTQPPSPERPWADRMPDVALAVVRHLSAENRWGPDEPELLVLEAQLLLHQGMRALSSDIEIHDECHKLCSRALSIRPSFLPAERLREQLQQTDQGVTLAPGETFLGRFRVVARLRSGSFGQVYRATDLNGSLSEEAVALKLVRNNASSPEERQRRQRALEREAQIMRRLNHPHVVRTFDYLEEHRCIVMEFVEGWTAADKIETLVTIDWTQGARIGAQLASALEYAARTLRRNEPRKPEEDFAHRDIHPGNIMVIDSHDGPHAKLLDFGQARMPGTGTSTTAALDGVNRWMIYRDPAYGSGMNAQSDMFALGVVLYQLVGGRGPYDRGLYTEFLRDPRGQHRAEVLESFRLVSELVVGATVHPAFVEILTRLTKLGQRDRYPDWDSVLRAFEAVPTSLGAPR